MAKRPAKAPKAAQPVPAAADEPHDAGEPLDNARHELFAQGLAQGIAIGKAYELAGFKASPASATRLSKEVKVRDRVSAILGQVAVRVGVTIETMTAQFDEDRAFARFNANPSAAVQSSKLKAQLHGLLSGDGGADPNKNPDGSVTYERIERIIVRPDGSTRPIRQIETGPTTSNR